MSDAALPSPWIVSRTYDLAWFFGGAALSLLVLALHLGAGVSIVALWWIWILGFDGPHMAAAFTRTYADREEWRRRPAVLGASLLAFAVGPACLALNLVTGSASPFLLFLAVATFYSSYHLVRQHYGFVALYRARSGDRSPVRFDRLSLYVGCWAPYGYLLVSHPKARAILGLPSSASPAERAGAVVLALLYVIALLAFSVRALSRPAGPKAAYFLATLLRYGIAYLLVARLEPVYTASRGPDEDFLLLSILLGITHNVEYIGLVWFHNRNRYAAKAADFGPARVVNGSVGRYLATCAAFSLTVYLAVAASTGVFPGPSLGLTGHVGPFAASQLALAVWWGIALNHYIVDQKIWRIRGDAELARNLRLTPVSA